MRRKCAGEVASGVIAAASEVGSQRTAPASSLSPCFDEVPVFIYRGVKATISEAAGEGFTGHAEEPTQMVR